VVVATKITIILTMSQRLF